MFTWLAILCCHLMCDHGETKSPCKPYEGKKNSKKRKRLGHKMIHGKAIWKPGIGETSKASRGSAPEPHKAGFAAPHMNLQLQEVILLMHIGLWPTSVKLNPSWKSEVSRSAWINPWISMGTYIASFFFLFFLSGNLDNQNGHM